MSSSDAIATPTLPTSPCAIGCVGVVAHLRRQVEGDREAGLALLEQVVVALVRLRGRAEAGVLPHRPEAPAVHRRMDAARERVLAGARRDPGSRSAGRSDRCSYDGGLERTRVAVGTGLAHSGMFPCFFGGFVSRLVRRSSSAAVEARARVARLDHLVDVAALRGHVGIRELLPVLADALVPEPAGSAACSLSLR